jgi:hypothetical protein
MWGSMAGAFRGWIILRSWQGYSLGRCVFDHRCTFTHNSLILVQLRTPNGPSPTRTLPRLTSPPIYPLTSWHLVGRLFANHAISSVALLLAKPLIKLQMLVSPKAS